MLRDPLLRRSDAALHVVGGSIILFSLLSFPVHALTEPSVDAEERVRFARMDGFWSTRKSDTLLSVAGSFFPMRQHDRDNLISDLIKLNRLEAAPADPLPPGRRLELPTYLMRPATPLPSASEAHAGNPFRMPRNGPQITTSLFPAYRDQLINANVEEPDNTDERLDGEPQGRRSIAMRFDTRFQRLSPEEFSVDKGISVSSQFDTLDYGDVRIDVASRQDDSAYAGGTRSGNLVTVSHDGLAISENLRADSVLGVIRAPGNYFVGSGARFGLPPLIFEGIATTLNSPGRQVHFAQGHLGRVEGNAAQTFRPSAGRLFSLGFNQGLGASWKAGTQWLAVHGLGQSENGSSAAAAIEFAPPDASDGLVHLKLQALSGIAGGSGIWADGEWIYGRIMHRFGAYRFDPGLRWGNIDLANDLQGTYWRADARQGPHAYTLGMDISETNLKRDPLRAGTLTRTLFGSASRRMNRLLTVGSALELRHNDGLTNLAYSAIAFKLSGFATITSDWGISRFDIYTGRKRDSPPSRDRIAGAGWSHEWNQLSGMTINSSIGVTQQSEQGKLSRMVMAGITGRKGISDRISGDAGLILSRNIDTSGTGSEASVTTNLSFQITADWSLSTGLMLRRTASAGGSGTQDIRALVSLSYEKSSGIPYSRLYGSRSGTGSIHGVVFYDENNDGVQQATEKAATNVTVYLDGRLAATTDAGGRFVFPVLPAGEHALSLRPEALPLPWTAEPASLQVRVPLRGAASVSLPLTRLPG